MEKKLVEDAVKLLIAKAILQSQVSPLPASFDAIWEQSSDNERDNCLKRATRVIEVLSLRGCTIAQPSDATNPTRGEEHTH